MKERLVIIGAGGLGREILAWAEDLINSGKGWYIGGFLDDDQDALKPYEIDLPIMGSPNSYQPVDHDVFVCAIGDPTTRLRVCQTLLARGAKFPDLIHPTAVLGRRVRFGTGFIACPHVCLTSDVRLGDFVFLNVSASIGHDAVLGNGCTLSGHCDVTGYAQLGRGVFMGSHSCIHPGVRVGDFARVGAGSVVMRNVPEHTTVLGVPAKKLPDIQKAA